MRAENQELEAMIAEKNAKIEDMEQEIKILRLKGQEEEELSAKLGEKLAVAVE